MLFPAIACHYCLLDKPFAACKSSAEIMLQIGEYQANPDTNRIFPEYVQKRFESRATYLAT
jgi:hypothetical protein